MNCVFVLHKFLLRHSFLVNVNFSNCCYIDMGSNTIPEEEEEYDDVGQVSSEPIDDSIYEEVKGIAEIFYFVTCDHFVFSPSSLITLSG